MGHFQESWVWGALTTGVPGGRSLGSPVGGQALELTWVSEQVWITDRQACGMRVLSPSFANCFILCPGQAMKSSNEWNY